MSKKTTKKTTSIKKANEILAKKTNVCEENNTKFRKAKFNISVIADIKADVNTIDLRTNVYDALAKVLDEKVPDGSIKLVDVKQLSSVFL